MIKWRRVDDFFDFSNKGITPKYVEKSSVIVLNQKCIRNNTIDYSFAQYTDDTIDIKEKAFIEVGDILINSTGQGTAGRCAFVKKLPEGKKVIIDSHILRLKGKSYYETQCLSYSLYSIENILQTYIDGSTGQGEFDKVRFFNLLSSIPKNNVIQQKLASILSTLDDKIELNNRINSELESMAKTFYDYWFVQFDFPDVNGKPYKSSGGKMVYNKELKREIPEGWELKKLKDVLSTFLGGTPSTNIPNYWDNGVINWLNSGEVSNFPIIDSEKKITEEAIENSTTNFLPSGSVLLSITRHIRATVLGIDACINQSVVGIKENDKYKYYYIYPYITNEIPQFLRLRTGAQQPHINKDIVDNALIIIPNEKGLMDKYNMRVGSLYDKIMCNAKENQRLAALRDWLLPMLMNGQIGFKENLDSHSS